jgi:tetratricopeptide (TPR) repeat protein
VSARAAWALVVLLAAPARADDLDEARADRAFHDAAARAAVGDAGALDALEQLGAARPATRWTDDAWLEAGRLAERTGDYARARRDLEQAIATATDEQLARHARAELARVVRAAGPSAEWSAVAAEHDRLEAQVLAGGDPKPALAELEALVEHNPGYPRAAAAMIVIARGWAHDGNSERSLAWLRRAKPVASGGDRVAASAELVHALVRAGELAAARAELDQVGVPGVAEELRREVARAERREAVRWLLRGVLAAISIAAALALRFAAGSWRAAGRRLVRPPVDVLYFAPIALVLVVVAFTGNPLVARAVRTIALAGAVVAWLSGAILDAVRARRGRIRFARAVVHAAVAAVAVVAATYLAIDRDRMIDLVVETWHTGPEPR